MFQVKVTDLKMEVVFHVIYLEDGALSKIIGNIRFSLL